MSAPYHLQRFVEAQTHTYATALGELNAGRKRSHWMWFIFPQLAGLGHSDMAQRYAIDSVDEARAYLDHAVLGPRLLACSQALLKWRRPFTLVRRMTEHWSCWGRGSCQNPRVICWRSPPARRCRTMS